MNYLIEVLREYQTPSGHIIPKGTRLFLPKTVAEDMCNSKLGKMVNGRKSEILSTDKVVYSK